MSIEASTHYRERVEEWDRTYRYSHHFVPWEAWQPSPDLIRLVERGEIKKGQRALDLGCGLGTQSLYLTSQGVEVVGLDISPAALGYAVKRTSGGGGAPRFLVGDALSLPFADESFDLVYDRGCFHHQELGGRFTYMREVARVLRVGGGYQLIAFQHRISSQGIYELFGSHFIVLSIESAQFRERLSGILRYFYCAFMRKRAIRD
ncbi:MAG: class I SAM-dependent methyltransferase [Chloroflexi bacterium]|nr:class I SAM-dependent methyltransferase [Chloroflexota bacterium]